ncbi:hypothetical protein ACSXBP_11355 [Clostridium perfringens]|uniref:hypothetical protein n=1 Tax=Clostridium perfringens TaxID=1502 RepID=UPI001896A7B8|nr:hypothetical protein [Clostridium perfringens]HAT4093250.1 hypothetical protein [Clostridium perfringens]
MFHRIPSWKYLLDLNEEYNDIKFSSIFLDNIVKNNYKLNSYQINIDLSGSNENI